MSSALDLSLGAIEVGTLIATLLYGAATMQAYTYARNCTEDPVLFRAGVLIVWVGETFLTILNFMWLYFLTVTNYGVPSTVDDLPWSAALSFWIIGMLSVAVECFYAWRIKTLSKQWFIPVVSWAGSLLHLGANTAIFFLALKAKTIANYEASYDWTITFSLTTETVVDFLNTAALCYYLNTFRQNGFRGTATMIDRMLSWTLETGLIIAVVAIIMLILNRTTPASNAIWVGMLMFYPKLFSNSLFLSLNSRHMLRRERSAAVNSSGLSDGRIGTGRSGAQSVNPALAVTVQQMQITTRDVELGTMSKRESSDEEERPSVYSPRGTKGTPYYS